MYKVIIAEDEELILRGLSYSIPWAELDCSIVGEAHNGEEALVLIRELKPDILLADINMPIKDGISVLRETKEQYGYSAILLTGYASFDYAREAVHLGVTEYLLKPLNRAELMEAVEHAKEQRRSRIEDDSRSHERMRLRAVNVLAGFTDASGDDPVQKMLKYIELHYAEKIVMQDVVRELNFSETFLNKQFRTQMGTSFNEYLNRYRIQRSLELLRGGSSSVAKIAEQCGFRDAKYFAYVFNKYIGCSPKEYAAAIYD